MLFIDAHKPRLSGDRAERALSDDDIAAIANTYPCLAWHRFRPATWGWKYADQARVLLLGDLG